MKKLLLIISIISQAALLPACKNKDLIICDHSEEGNADFNVIIHWDEDAKKPDNGMMLNFLALGSSPEYGHEYLNSCEGGKVCLPYETNYQSLCYDYYAENINFTDDHLEAYCQYMVRATYSRAFPDENTVQQPGYPFWVDRVGDFYVDGSDLHFYMKNVVKKYTFEIRGIEGLEYISATRGAISGMSASYFLCDGGFSAEPYSILFDSKRDTDKGIITGYFYTFGRLDTEDNMFTIELLYPSRSGGIMHGTWDVTDQVINAQHLPNVPDILIINDGEIPPVEPDGDSMFQPDVDDWNDVIVTIPM